MVGEGWEAFRYQGGLQEYVTWMNKVGRREYVVGAAMVLYLSVFQNECMQRPSVGIARPHIWLLHR
jgi:hypothetical protein